jgi:DNA-binding LytR/AlgR family response regulator
MVPDPMRDVHHIEGAGDYVTLRTGAGQVLAVTPNRSATAVDRSFLYAPRR